jgi:hypothetical protein
MPTGYVDPYGLVWVTKGKTALQDREYKGGRWTKWRWKLNPETVDHNGGSKCFPIGRWKKVKELFLIWQSTPCYEVKRLWYTKRFFCWSSSYPPDYDRVPDPPIEIDYNDSTGVLDTPWGSPDLRPHR